ncbi:hypothetical protein [Microbacterium sp. gxy059]|uniref:hypothetical protein n=1 Tax=Microbacterium sp. gxy059 TaxID=2957199 RepID=UPI003D98A6C7
MSTSRAGARGAERRRRHRARYLGAFAVVLGGLTLLAGAGAVASLVQGPRVTEVQADPAGSIAQSGSRVILTANQALAGVDPERVSVTPATDFTVDAAGRTVGVRFPAALDADTTYTVRVEGVRGLGGGPESTLETAFTTPPAEVFVLERDESGDDVIRQRTVGGGEGPVVLSAERIDDFRATSEFVVATVVEGEAMRLVAVDLSGARFEDEGFSAESLPTRDLELPGEGVVTGMQVSERGQLYGYTYTDRDISADSGRASVLFTGSLRRAFDQAEAPQPVVIGGEEPQIDRWRFVPETSSLLLNDFGGDLTLIDRESADTDPTSFGLALGIEGVARSTYTAIIDRSDTGLMSLDLATGEESSFDDVELDGETVLNHLVPTPDGGSVRSYAQMEDGMPIEMRVVRVSADGEASDVARVAEGDALLQVCASPSAQFTALAVAPSLAQNPYDLAPQPMPRDVETRIVETRTGEEVETVPGFDVSWCEVGPW